MADLDPAIERYIATDIALNARDISECAASREWFLTRIQNEIEADADAPQLLAASPFVNFGSYFKRTKVRDVDEFDVLVVIDSNSGVFTSGGERVGEGQGDADPNHSAESTARRSISVCRADSPSSTATASATASERAPNGCSSLH
jgi:hypothetical protein